MVMILILSILIGILIGSLCYRKGFKDGGHKAIEIYKQEIFKDDDEIIIMHKGGFK